MAQLHDPATRADLERRIGTLRPDTRGRWGKMSVDQMLWHCCQATALSLGQVTLPGAVPPLPKPLLRVVALWLPWVKGAPTHPDLMAKGSYDFDAERQRLLQLIADAANWKLEADWPEHPAFGRMTGPQVSRLLARHLDHHLRQFGAD